MTQNRADIIRRAQKASSLQEQGRIVAELDAFDRQAREATATAASADWAGMVVQATLAPATAHERSTMETDWLGEVTAADNDWANKVTAEAALWYRRVSEAVKADPEEFAEQLKGIARRTASAYGEQMEDAERQFTDYIAFLHRQAASGLPQVEQLVDAHENPAQTPLPEDTFDNFAPPVHPINEGVSGTESSERAPLIQEIERNGGEGGGDPSHHDETQQFEGPAPVEARPGVQGTTAYFQPSVAIGHTANLTDYLANLQAEAASCGCPGVDDGDPHMSDCPIKTGGGGYGRDPYDAYDDDWDGHEGSRKEGASSLDQIQQVVDNQENPKPTPLNPEVAFPWMLEEEPEEEERSDKKKSSLTPAEARAAHVARLVAKPDSELTATDRQEIQAYAGSLFKQADQWSQSGPQYQGPGPANSPATTPVGTGGTEQAGEAAGRADRAAADAPTFSDASSSVPPFVQGYADGYGTGETQLPGATPGQLPPGAGGMNQGYQTHAASLQTEAKQVECDGCGKTDSHFNMQQRGNGSSVQNLCTTCAPTPTDPNKVRWQGSLQVSASFTSPVEQADPEFRKGYKFASKWTDGKRLVTQGSASFEAGLYAGMSDNPAAQAAWVKRHQAASQRYKDGQYAKRIEMHAAFTKQAAQALNGVRIEGSYLAPYANDQWNKTAATTTDLDTMGPGVSPNATGQTPINGPGTPPLLEGGTDPARPGGPAPYNGAEPYGTSAVPTGPAPIAEGTAPVVNTTPGGPVDQAAHQRLNPQSLAFRQRVQATVLNDKTRS